VLRPSVPERALPDGRLNRLAGPDAWDNPEWYMFNRAMDLPPGGDHMHRKPFELTQCIWGLERLGALTPDTVALGVGAGHDHAVFYLANRCGMMVATDLYSGAFTDSPAAEADPGFMQDPPRYAPFAYHRDRLRVMPADALHLPFADKSFDVVYSLSSIEHFGSKESSANSVREMARVTKPGGIVCIATEWILNGVDHPEFFTPEEFDRYVMWASDLIPVEPLDDRLPPTEYLDDPVKVPDDIFRTPHLVVTDGRTTWTSVIVFLRKPRRGETLRQMAARLPVRLRS
jgi:SAM-dependent methyltransferase